MNDAARFFDARRGFRGGGTSSVKSFELATGMRLEPLFRSGKTPLLVAHGYRTGGGGFAQFSAGDAAAKRRGGQRVERVTIPMFALIETQPFANRVSIGTATRAAQTQFPRDFSRALKANLR
mgnify:FL=1